MCPLVGCIRPASDGENALLLAGARRERWQVDATRDVVQGTIHQMLSNQEQLSSLQGKTDAIANQSAGFYRGARTTRRELQCQEYKGKLLCAAAAVFLFLFFFGGLFSGGGDNGDDGRSFVWHVPPSPPPPELSS